MKILVTGGTGTVGSVVVRELLARGVDVSVLTRDAKKPLQAGVTAVEGNLLEVATVRRVFDGVDAVLLLVAVSETESAQALMALTAMRNAGVERVVYISVQQADEAPWLPHFGSKVGIEAGLEKAGIPWTILRPNSFYQNDHRYKNVLLQHGVYPQPLGSVGVSRVDVRDIAEAAAIALTQPGQEGQRYDLVGPAVWTGESTARVWSEALGRPVAYAGDDLVAWEKQMRQFMPDWMVFDLVGMYAFFQQQGFKASEEAVERQTSLIGHAPRAFEAFATETARAWQDAPRAG
jgi:uncharacterized protein YbjT (DUF2867 family)